MMAVQAEFHPPDWLPLLQAAVAASRSTEDEENARAFQLLQSAAESGNDEVRSAPAIRLAFVLISKALWDLIVGVRNEAFA
jgi:hypothetical protein